MGVGAAVVSTGLLGCADRDSDDDNNVSFAQGVASGDPLADSVILWTRALPNDTDAVVTVDWEVATDSGFDDLIHNGSTTTDGSKDFTVKIDVQNLSSGTVYYYRFRANGTTSAEGTTKTLPEGSLEQAKLAVVSCANFPAGYFHAYGEIAALDDIDAVLHLGDYIYEYADGDYATEDAEALGRQFAAGNAGECIELDDYRNRYAHYRGDENLQALHRKQPFITIWDDHEVANDSWREGAENHNPEAGEGEYLDRKLAALQAWFEWMPVRPASEGDEEIIYRSFEFGDLLSLHMLDTRIIGRDEQIDYTDYQLDDYNAPDLARFNSDVQSSDRTLLGATQLNWLQTAMQTSSATWQVLGQQVLMGKLTLPVELQSQILDPNPDTLFPAFIELAGLKQRYIDGDVTLTQDEIKRVTTVVPYNLDAWDGYDGEREAIYATAKDSGKNLVVLAGDSHNAWANDLVNNNGDTVGVEFATASVSSPGLEEYLSLGDDLGVAGVTEGLLKTLADDLRYVNVAQRGFVITTFTPDEATSEWFFIDTVKSETYTLDDDRKQAMKTVAGTPELVLL
ncbi:Phospholipase D [Sinobacterium norvegicum]|uniref:Phospholipase D n=2 Tax=Sinobacterium norvegicum TaxID=1641715 RepID=A0ABN8EC35_9GAMM|nr:Phospholipase D [Sinobacterium norvegicum]